MEFPDGHNSHHHHHHHHHHRTDPNSDEERSRNEAYPRPPSDQYPPYGYGGAEFAAPRPPVVHSHTSHYSPSDPYPSPPDQRLTHSYPPNYYPPPPTQYPPSVVQHVSHEVEAAADPNFSNKPTVKIFCKAEPNYSLTIRDQKVILARSNPNDPYQHWYKDHKYSTRIKDEAGFPCFALVNKATGLALKHSVGAAEPVQIIPYNSEKPDLSILWTESNDFGEGYRSVRMVNNIHLNMDAFHGDEASGGVRDGTTIVLWQWNNGPNQLWKINPY